MEVGGVEPPSRITPILSHSQVYLVYYHKLTKIAGFKTTLTDLLHWVFLIFTTYLLCCPNWIDGLGQPPDYAAKATDSKCVLLFATMFFELLRSFLTYLHSFNLLPCRSLDYPLKLIQQKHWNSRLNNNYNRNYHLLPKQHMIISKVLLSALRCR